MINSEDLIRSFKEVPETKLKILDLARGSVKEDGSLDLDALAYRSEEVKEATDEAEAYISEVEELVARLAPLMRG
jgi:hypothetical protein